MTQTILVTPAGAAYHVEPAPDPRPMQRRVSGLYQRQKAITLAKSPAVLAKIKGNPVPKGQTYD